MDGTNGTSPGYPDPDPWRNLPPLSGPCERTDPRGPTRSLPDYNPSIAWLSFRIFIKDVFSCRLLAILYINCILRPYRKMPPKTFSIKTAKNVDFSSQPPEKEIDVIQSFSPVKNLLFLVN